MDHLTEASSRLPHAARFAVRPRPAPQLPDPRRERRPGRLALGRRDRAPHAARGRVLLGGSANAAAHGPGCQGRQTPGARDRSRRATPRRPAADPGALPLAGGDRRHRLPDARASRGGIRAVRLPFGAQAHTTDRRPRARGQLRRQRLQLRRHAGDRPEVREQRAPQDENVGATRLRTWSSPPSQKKLVRLTRRS